MYFGVQGNRVLLISIFHFHWFPFPAHEFLFLKSPCIPAWLPHMVMETKFKCPERKGLTEIFHKTCDSRQLISIWFLLITMKCCNFSLLAQGVTQMVWFDISRNSCGESLQQGCNPNVKIVTWEHLYGSLLFCRQVSTVMPYNIYRYLQLLYTYFFVCVEKRRYRPLSWSY